MRKESIVHDYLRQIEIFNEMECLTRFIRFSNFRCGAPLKNSPFGKKERQTKLFDEVKSDVRYIYF